MSTLCARIERGVSILIQIIFVLAGIGMIIIFLPSYWVPAVKLVADIYPMEFRVPVNGGELAATARSTQPINPAIVHMLTVANANGFARIDLKNVANVSVDEIHVWVSGADIYVKGTPKNDNSIVSPMSEVTGITLPKLPAGSSITIYVWSSIISGSYSSLDTLRDQFTITSSQGIVDRRFHITVGTVGEFIDKHFTTISSVFGLLVLLSIVGLITRAFRFRQN